MPRQPLVVLEKKRTPGTTAVEYHLRFLFAVAVDPASVLQVVANGLVSLGLSCALVFK
jgi:hypothetical protein